MLLRVKEGEERDDCINLKGFVLFLIFDYALFALLIKE
jgi:hypothetical protein